MKRRIIIISIVAVGIIAIAALTIFLLMMIQPHKTAPLTAAQSLSKQADQKATEGFADADADKTSDALKSFQEAYDLYKQANDKLGMSKAQMYIDMNKLDQKTETTSNKSVPIDGPITTKQ